METRQNLTEKKLLPKMQAYKNVMTSQGAGFVIVSACGLTSAYAMGCPFLSLLRLFEGWHV